MRHCVDRRAYMAVESLLASKQHPLSPRYILLCNNDYSMNSCNNELLVALGLRVIIDNNMYLILLKRLCLLLGPTGFNCLFFFVVFCCFFCLFFCFFLLQCSSFVVRHSGINTLFLSRPHLCFIIVFIRVSFVSREKPSRGPND